LKNQQVVLDQIESQFKEEKMQTEILTSHTISIYVANKPGVLVRVAQVFARRGFNVDSLVVSPAIDGNFSRITITAQGNPENIDQINKQVAKLIDVIHVSEHNQANVLEKELALIKIAVTNENRTEILQIIDHFKAITVDFSHASMIVQVTGSTEKLDSLMSMLEKYEILEVVRTGKILMARGEEVT
jgi:acetolactate synthase-1/3 small subunit